MKTIAIIGSTGSIGTSALKVIKKNSSNFKLEYLYAKNNYKKLNDQLKKFNPKYIFLEDKKYIKKLKSNKKLLPFEKFIKRKKKIDYIILATSGYSFIKKSFKLLKICRNLLVANKESIICGGNVFKKVAKKNSCKILSIDSEHYCINYFLNNFYNKNLVKTFYLTASGGPFLKKSFKNPSIKNVLNHPTWKMGKKISVNSANLTNKVMELFEAYFLFQISPNKLKIKIESTSKIHSVISLNNGLDFFIAHSTNMTIPIENTLMKNNQLLFTKKNLMVSNKLKFELLNPKKNIFTIINTGYKVMKLGNRAMIIFTVLNDRLVEMFLDNKKKFHEITNTLIKIFRNLKIVNYAKKDIRNLKDILETINFAKSIIL